MMVEHDVKDKLSSWLRREPGDLGDSRFLGILFLREQLVAGLSSQRGKRSNCPGMLDKDVIGLTQGA